MGLSSTGSESRSPPAWLNDTWDNDPEIQSFLWEYEVPHAINSHPSPSPGTSVLPQPAVTAFPLNQLEDPTSSSSLNTMPDTVVQLNQHGQLLASAQKRAFFPDDTEPHYLAKRVKLDPEGSATKRKRPEDTDVSEDDKWDSDPPTSPEYKISSASDGGGSDTSDSPSSPSAKRPKVKKARRKKNKKETWDSDRSMSEPSDLDYESEEEYFIPAGERDDELLNNKLTRERAKRLLEAVELPQGHDLSPDEQRTAHQLLAHDETQHNESHFVLENNKCSEFYAIRAFQELLKICGNVRDYCNILDIGPGIYIKKSIEKYLRWALSDAGVRVQPETPRVHVIYCQNQDEEPKEAFSKVAKTLEKLSNTWQSLLTAPHDGEAAWPALMGLVLCGPVLSVISLDTNPNPQTQTQGIKFLGHFDLSDFDNDVWNTLAVAIIVMHIKRTVTKLAKAYDHRFVASIVDNPAMGSPDLDH
ncbi:hypothetical protein N7453_010371 [Penicillium expansum]|nr:hypothetical protein N7453_010371 [Penicillium expansum]